jgi:NAD(P)-dependent dehydrogenase (short-subunit alcohol dehydrogenase family)
VVTGASRGIGRAIAERLAADGALVAVHYGSNQVAAEETVARIARAGGNAFAIRAGLGDDQGVDALFGGLDEGLSGRALDILVNNAAVPPAGPIESSTPEEFDRLFAVNVKAPFFIIQRAIPRMSGRGRIITISSVATRVAIPTQTSFAMAKGAVETMSLTLANELGARGITVNAVAPGTTKTDANAAVFEQPPGTEAYLASMTALDRLGRADDVADAVAFLASDDGRWVTGHVLDVSGGMHLGPRAPSRT